MGGVSWLLMKIYATLSLAENPTTVWFHTALYTWLLGLGNTVGQCLGVLFADNGMVGSCYFEWLKHAMNIPVGLFRSYGLEANVAKSRTMICQPSALQAEMPEEFMAPKCTGVVDSYQVRL